MVKVNFFGGEPLMNWPLIAPAIAHARKVLEPYTPNLIFSLNTNAALLTPEIARFLVENRVVAYVSLDGLEASHDSMRVDRGGAGTFQRVIKGLRTLVAEADADYLRDCLSVLCTVSTSNLDDALPLLEFAAGLGIKNLSFNEAAMCVGSQKESLGAAQVSDESFFDQTLQLYERARELDIAVGGMWGHLRHRLARGGLKFCPALGNEMGVRPNGSIFPCPVVYRDSNQAIGHLKPDGSMEVTPRYAAWAERYATRIRACRKCEIVGICRGGCAGIAQGQSESIYEPQGCTYYKLFTEYFLWRLPD
jgi:uncharacterized protein